MAAEGGKERDALGWGEWSVPRVPPSANRACFDLRAGPPVLIHRPLLRTVPHAGWRDARSLLGYLRGRFTRGEEDDDGHWKKPQIRVIARARSSARATGSNVHATEEEWMVTSEVDEIPKNAAYVQMYWGKRTAELVTRAAAPEGALPSCLRLRNTDRSLILFLSLHPTLSGTHRDQTNSVLYCVTGMKVPGPAAPHQPLLQSLPPLQQPLANARGSSESMCWWHEQVVYITHPDAPAQLKQKVHEGFPNHLVYEPFDDPAPSLLWKRVELVPGASLFIPAGWWHSVYSLAGV